jgi:hypothetical protein
MPQSGNRQETSENVDHQTPVSSPTGALGRWALKQRACAESGGSNTTEKYAVRRQRLP